MPLKEVLTLEAAHVASTVPCPLLSGLDFDSVNLYRPQNELTHAHVRHPASAENHQDRK